MVEKMKNKQNSNITTKKHIKSVKSEILEKIEGLFKYAVLLTFMAVGPITIAIFEYKVYTLRNETLINKEYVGLSQLDSGIAILAIAVSVWIGLNIYTNFKESYIEKKLNQIKEETESLRVEYVKMQFINELEKTRNIYEISEYFVVNFQEQELPETIIDSLISFERAYCECCGFYEKQVGSKKCTESAEQALKSLEIIQEKILKYKDIYILKVYVRARKSDLLFYKNVRSSEFSRIEMEDSIKIYEELLDDEEIQFSNVQKAYIYNTLGYSQLRLSKFYDKDQCNKLLDNARCNLEMAIEYHQKGRYYQNLGAVLEKRKLWEDAKKCYEDALEADLRDPKVYNLLGSLYLKIVDDRIGINKRFGIGEVLYGFSKDSSSEIVEMINQARAWLMRSISSMPDFVDAYFNFGKAELYYWLFIKQDDARKQSAKEYIEMAYTFTKTYATDKKISCLFTLRNYYEGIGKIKKAYKVNEEIYTLSNRYIGDTKEAKELYEKIIRKKWENEKRKKEKENDV